MESSSSEDEEMSYTSDEQHDDQKALMDFIKSVENEKSQAEEKKTEKSKKKSKKNVEVKFDTVDGDLG